ncbi:MAG: hypothetical protein KAJ49_11265 [Arcobacteraceae bacterium]|nr:hypothetical protein [Arcobacteraceae bacterium]
MSIRRQLLFISFIFTYPLTASNLNDNNKTKNALEMFMFKVGITSLTYDLENEKKNIFNNSSEIEQLKKDIKYLLKQNIKNKLVIKEDISLPINNTQNKDITNLKLENEKLKLYIQKLENKNKVTKSIEKIVVKINVQKVSTRKIPFQNGEIIRYLYLNDIIKIENCDKYGWCKLQDKEEYIPKFKLEFIRGDS